MGTHPIFESDFDCLTVLDCIMDHKPRNIMPAECHSGLGLSTAGQNTAGMMQHPIEKCGKTMLQQDAQHNMNLALKNQGRGFALGLQMEQLMCQNRPRVPGRSLRTMGTSILSGRCDRITLEDYVGETEGVEMLHTFAYPM